MRIAVCVVLILVVGGIAGIRFHKAPPVINPPMVILKPCASPKSLVKKWEEEQTAWQQDAYAFKRPYREPPYQPLAFYAGSEAPENLIAERESVGRLRWGPMAIDTPYEVTWRGAGEIHVRGDFKQAQEDLRRLEPDALIRLAE